MNKYINIQCWSLIYYNFFCRQVKRTGGKLIPYKESCFIFHKTAKLILNGNLRLNDNCISKNGRSSILRIDENARMVINDGFSAYYGADIICFRNSELILGSGFFNSNVKIRCTQKIEIGNNVAISHDVTIMDSDAHSIDCDKSKATAPIFIADNVWIGSRALILKGVSIGRGAVVAAGSVVTKDIPENTLVAGVPARPVRKVNIWGPLND